MKFIIALPVHNEEEVLAQNTRTLVWRLRNFGYSCRVVVADNGSSDGTALIGLILERELPEVSYMRIPEKGKGLAIREAWQKYPADFCGFMDIDLAAGLESLPDLIAAAEECGGIAFGSRSAAGAEVERSILRGFLSRGYRFLTGLIHGFWHDSKCGFKLVSRGVLERIVPDIEDNGFFFDTELLLRARAAGFALREVPVRWMETPNPRRRSKIMVMSTLKRDFLGLLRLRFEPLDKRGRL